MTAPQPAVARNLASQFEELTSQATDEMIQRSKKRLTDAAAAAKAPVMSRSRMSLIALCVSAPVLAGLLTIAFFGDSLAEAFSAPASPQVVRAQAQTDLDLAVRGIESFRADFSTLPQTLAQIGVPGHGDWTYTKREGGQYQVVRALHGQVVTFNSGQQKVVSNEK